MQEEKNGQYNEEEQEIDLLELAKKLWSSRRTLFMWGGIGALVGLVIAFSIPKEYTTTIKLSPELTGSGGFKGNLDALASMAGINRSSSSQSDAVYPDLYPDVVSSVPFAIELFDVKVLHKDGTNPVTVREYLTEETSAPWWSAILSLPGKAIGGIMSLFKSDEDTEGDGKINPFHLTPDESGIVDALNSRVQASVDSKTSVITLSATMQDPMVSAMLADTVATKLREYITDYRTEKARNDLEYAQKLNEEARDEYHKAQQRYAEYVDRNQGIVLRSANTETERLQNEASLAFNLYNQTATQLQMAKAQVQQTTPVYTVVQPATVPLRASKPSKMLILVGCIFLAVVAASAWVLFLKDLAQSFKTESSKETEQ